MEILPGRLFCDVAHQIWASVRVAASNSQFCMIFCDDEIQSGLALRDIFITDRMVFQDGVSSSQFFLSKHLAAFIRRI